MQRPGQIGTTWRDVIGGPMAWFVGLALSGSGTATAWSASAALSEPSQPAQKTDGQAADLPGETSRAKMLLVLAQSPVKPGNLTTVGVVFDIAPEWHMYWNGQFEVGMGAEISWTLPSGYSIEGLDWPAPTRHVQPGNVIDHIYEGKFALLARVAVPANAAPGTRVTLLAKAKYLICNSEVCVPGDGEASVEFVVGAATSGAGDTERDRQTGGPSTTIEGQVGGTIGGEVGRLLAASQARVPLDLVSSAHLIEVEFEKPGNARADTASDKTTVVARIRAKSTNVANSGRVTRLMFFPGVTCTSLDEPIADGESALATERSDGVESSAELRIRMTPQSPGERARVAGVVEIWREGAKTPQFVSVDSSIPMSAGGRSPEPLKAHPKLEGRGD